MPRTQYFTSIIGILIFLVVLVVSALAQAQTFTVVYNFTRGSDGAYPFAGVIQDRSGNLYGTAQAGGGANYGGVVFEMNTAGKETVLHSFIGPPLDGALPNTPVVRDKAGNIYGTTTVGGSSGNYGTVFKIDTEGKEKVLYRFSGGSDGCDPDQGLVRDKAGNLYGTAYWCGIQGVVFKVTKSGTFTVLHSFIGAPIDGGYPADGHLTMGRSGDLYGVTSGGGSFDDGALYRLSRSGTLTLLHSFHGSASDGCGPVGSVILDGYGNLYGTTSGCGSIGGGTIWKVSKEGKETILHNFTFDASDGCAPIGITRDLRGNLYGVTRGCGVNGYGALYKLSAAGKLTLLHSFDSADGWPYGEVLWTAGGVLYGTTMTGGTYGYGTVWSYAP